MDIEHSPMCFVMYVRCFPHQHQLFRYLIIITFAINAGVTIYGA